MRVAHAAATLALALVPGVCPRHERPAVVTAPSAKSRAELARVVGRALGRTSVTLADDALTRESTLVVERRRLTDGQGLPAQGRETGRPEHFRLVSEDGRCVLVHERTGKHWPLADVTCAPL